MIALPEKFIAQIPSFLPSTETQAFIQSLSANPPTSIRLNPQKINPNFEKNLPVKWNALGRYLTERPIFTLDPLFWAGTYYVQEASSMFIGEAIKQLFDNQAVTALDLCAAPGGKSTLLLDNLNDGSLVVSNEVIKSRVNVLSENLSRWGNTNSLITHNDPADFTKITNFFDLILVDAPCSGEGMFRKEDAALREWSPENVNLCAARQKRILTDIIPALKPGGYLIYSTCTYNRQENEENIAWLIQQGFSSVRLLTLNDWNITEVVENQCFTYRFYPHKTQGEGLFVAVLQKKDTMVSSSKQRSKGLFKRYEPLPKKQRPLLEKWLKNEEEFEFFAFQKNLVFALPKKFLALAQVLENQLRLQSLGLFLGEIKGNDFIPSPELALSLACSEEIAMVEVEKETALNFLRKQDIQLPDNQQGWSSIKYQNHGLGWVKILKNRVNNYYPNHWRIKHL
jgi:16S rRNA C967 or C1407 C5-methylase (RsmB/RsmF family)/NOL1/NOP2/fmu family ribosome biogenesis protein